LKKRTLVRSVERGGARFFGLASPALSKPTALGGGRKRRRDRKIRQTDRRSHGRHRAPDCDAVHFDTGYDANAFFARNWT
jgi:hypothetical protein